MLEDTLTELKAMFPNNSIQLTGDFNAFTRDKHDFIIDDTSSNIPLPEWYSEDNFNITRKSRDTHDKINDHGTSLLNLCCTFAIHFLNGRVTRDLRR